ALRATPELAAEWEPLLTSNTYDPRLVPAADKAGALCGMAMTEKQGGSDVRANTTVARPVNGGGPGGEYEISGHKWFCSAPMCDAFLVLAQTDAGISCFLMPRWTPDGERNRFHLQRLKDKLGNRSNASSEVEFRGAWARMVGEEGRGVPTIIEMVNHTRLDCATGAATGMRAGVAMAIHHTRERSAFGKLLSEQPLMRNVLAYGAALRRDVADLEDIEVRARGIVERMALALQASLLVRYGDPAVADAFCASRLEGDWGHAFGTLPRGTDFTAIIGRHAPHE